MMDHFDIVVVGGGPAGAAAAIVASGFGYSTLLVDKTPDLTFKIGEGFPAAGNVLLRRLGAWERFCHGGHLPCFGNQSVWGSTEPHTVDFIRDPHGHGWHLDRLAFDTMLRQVAVEAGAVFWPHAELINLESKGRLGWRVSIETAAEGREVSCKWVADATGRTSRAARRLGVKRHRYDELVSFYALFEPSDGAEPDCDSLTLIESVPDGWWYSALLPSGRRLVAFFTDAGTPPCDEAKHARGFDWQLAQTGDLSRRLAEKHVVRVTDPRPAAANSAHLERWIGPGWLAAGDAATSFDPLSSQGLYTALYHGIKAGEAMHGLLHGDHHAAVRYHESVASVYRTYLDNRHLYYTMETRWVERPFWARRVAGF